MTSPKDQAGLRQDLEGAQRRPPRGVAYRQPMLEKRQNQNVHSINECEYWKWMSGASAIQTTV